MSNRFLKPRPLLYALKDRVKKELGHISLITPVQFSDWAAPIVYVVKTDGTIRVCGDYNVTVNALSSWMHNIHSLM